MFVPALVAVSLQLLGTLPEVSLQTWFPLKLLRKLTVLAAEQFAFAVSWQMLT